MIPFCGKYVRLTICCREPWPVCRLSNNLTIRVLSSRLASFLPVLVFVFFRDTKAECKVKSKNRSRTDISQI